MSKTTKATWVFLGLLAAVVIYATLVIPKHECEVCLTFAGQTVCRTAASGTEEETIESATISACGTLASGMTESISCQNTPPDRVSCRPR